MFILYETGPMASVTELARFETFEAAEIGARARFKVAFFEVDADHAGCADFVTHACQIYCIEPAARRV